MARDFFTLEPDEGRRNARRGRIVSFLTNRFGQVWRENRHPFDIVREARRRRGK